MGAPLAEHRRRDPSRRVSSTICALRAAANSKAVIASLFTSRGMPFSLVTLIKPLPRGFVKQRLSDAGRFELLRQIPIEFLARETFQVIMRADALAQRLMHLQAIACAATAAGR